MIAGDLQQTVTVYENAYSRNDDGQKVETANEVCTRRAAIVPVSGNERRVGSQLVADITHIVTVRSDSITRAITPANWIMWGSRRLNISRSYDVGNGRQWVEMQCTERV